MSVAAPAVIRDLNPGPRAMLKHSEHQGKGTRRLTGGYIDDLAALGKAIMLCQRGCDHKFNAKGYAYSTRRMIPLAHGRCDGCGQLGDNRLFLPTSRTYL